MVRCESRPGTIGPITLDTKQTGAPSAGNLHAGCDVAGAGNGFTVRLMRHSQRKRGANKLGSTFGTPRQSSTRPRPRQLADGQTRFGRSSSRRRVQVPARDTARKACNSRSSGVVPTCRHPAHPPTSAGRSLTSVRVPGRVVRRRRSVGGRTNEKPRFTLACSSRPSVAPRPRVAARSPMSDVPWRATKPPRQRVNGLFTPACSSPPSVALRPRAAERSPTSGVSLPETKAAESLGASFAVGVAIAADERRSSIAARTRSVTSAAVAFHATECGAGDCRRSGYAQSVPVRSAALHRSTH
jgi:hypothetical protein